MTKYNNTNNNNDNNDNNNNNNGNGNIITIKKWLTLRTAMAVGPPLQCPAAWDPHDPPPPLAGRRRMDQLVILALDKSRLPTLLPLIGRR